VTLPDNCAQAVALDLHTALHAAALAQEFKLTSTDALVCASALRHGATTVTCDAHFDDVKGLDHRAWTIVRTWRVHLT